MNIIRKPDWIRKKLFNSGKEDEIKNIIGKNKIHTVCQEARCPNIGECFSKKTATFLLLGNICTRNCRFCNISGKFNKNLDLDLDEPKKVANAVSEMGLKYVVLTSVTRDDLPDGGASIFSETISEIKKNNQNVLIEVLVPDFMGNESSIDTVVESDIVVFNHNLETVKKNYKFVRPEANYERSLKVLAYAKRKNSNVLIKTGIMVGLGESVNDVVELMNDFKDIGGDIITIGQYLMPSKNHYQVVEYVTPEVFDNYKDIGKNMGFKGVISGPFVRSSYFAENYFFC
ncbi:MAG TPA: lipoyl synthase [Spirochaetota bacterium]|nr:lipoyl synthase [Spirochaetota bacterium]